MPLLEELSNDELHRLLYGVIKCAKTERVVGRHPVAEFLYTENNDPFFLVNAASAALHWPEIVGTRKHVQVSKVLLALERIKVKLGVTHFDLLDITNELDVLFRIKFKGKGTGTCACIDLKSVDKALAESSSVVEGTSFGLGFLFGAFVAALSVILFYLSINIG
jgi:hypothetical protein